MGPGRQYQLREPRRHQTHSHLRVLLLIYFILFPLLAIGIAAALALRDDTRGLRVFSLAVAMNYGIALPFFIFFPVPERWTYPESGAILLSDLCTRFGPKLIELFRQVGDGLDNCLPSFHVSFTAVMILVCCIFRLRLRTIVLALGTSIILSTFVLGIHWLADIAGGLLTGGLSVLMALRYSPAAGALHVTPGVSNPHGKFTG